MPEIVFKGKEYVYNHHLTVPYRPLVVHPDKGFGTPDLAGNLIIHGDNLAALKSLLPRYAGKVDLIFIDPPYNTGNEGWRYSDNVNSPIMKEWLSSNPVAGDDLLRHDKWLCMMWPRLVLLRELLSERGAIAVFIGHDEQHRLRALMDEIFGEQRFITTLSWRSRAKPNNTGDAAKKPQQDAEFVHVYGETGAKRFNRVTSGGVRRYPKSIGGRDYRLATILKSNLGGNERPDSMRGEVAGFAPSIEQRWQAHTDTVRQMHSDGYLEFVDGYPMQRVFEDEEPEENAPFYGFVERAQAGTAEGGKTFLNQVVPGHGFDTVKPMEIVDYLIRHLSKPDSSILDSFAGSGTTAHAVLKTNARDGGSRHFILIEGEDYADLLTAQRVRRAIDGYAWEGSQRETLLAQNITFTQLKKADALLAQVEAIKAREGFAEGDLADQGSRTTRRFDTIETKVDGGVLRVEGVRKVSERAPGLGGSFTYCTLGEPLDIERMLSGENLPSWQAIGEWLFHTATGAALQTPAKNAPEWYLGEANDKHVWLVYRPDLSFLKSPDAALTLSLARRFAEWGRGHDAGGARKGHLVFAPAKYLSHRQLGEAGVEFAALPYALYREV